MGNAQALPRLSTREVDPNANIPGAYRLFGQPRGHRSTILIPKGIYPGDSFLAVIGGQRMLVQCPENSRQGDEIQVITPSVRSPTKNYLVTVPPYAKASSQFYVRIENEDVLVQVSHNMRPGDQITFSLTKKERAKHETEKYHHLYEVTVPDGIGSGESFALIADGHRILVTCPRKAKSGQKIRFQLPIQLTSSQLEAANVKYNKDGWMRCLGADLKFHWIYNKAQKKKRQLTDGLNLESEQREKKGERGGGIEESKSNQSNTQQRNIQSETDLDREREEEENEGRMILDPIEEKRNAIFNLDQRAFIRVMGRHKTHKKSTKSTNTTMKSKSSSSSEHHENHPSHSHEEDELALVLSLSLSESQGRTADLTSSSISSSSHLHLPEDSSPPSPPPPSSSSLPLLPQVPEDEPHDSNTFTHEKQFISFIPASHYSIRAAVKGTSMGHEEISEIAKSPFPLKVDWIKDVFSQLRVPWEEGHVKIRIRRSHLLADTLTAFSSIEKDDLKKVFRYEFIGEPALDAGGVTREFYSLICDSICNPDVGLFLYSSVNQMCMQINHNSGLANEFHLKYFHVLGRILGKALMDGQITPIHFVQPLYKYLLGWPVTLKDLEHLDDQVYRNLIELMDFDDVSVLMLDFAISEDRLGQTENVELVPNGSDILVENETLSDYLEEQLKYRLFKRIGVQLLSFLSGFYEIVPEAMLSVLDYQELELLMHGLPEIDMLDWKRQTEYTGEFLSHPDHPVISWFWEILSEMPHTDQARLLQFVTGTSGVPAQGFAFLQGNDGNIRKFTLHGDRNGQTFPRSHTCFNRIDLPLYKNKIEMKKFLLLAVSLESSGFGIE